MVLRSLHFQLLVVKLLLLPLRHYADSFGVRQAMPCATPRLHCGKATSRVALFTFSIGTKQRYKDIIEIKMTCALNN